MKKIALSTACLVLFGISACRQAPVPDPSMTAVGAGSGMSSNSADWIDPSDLRRADELGLQVRDPAFSAGEGSDGRVENLFDPVYFEFNQSFIRPEDRSILQQVADYLFDNPSHVLLIEGHCDWRGTTEYNMALGDRRAASAQAYIAQIGIAPDRIETVSKGDLDALTEASEDQMALDRKAEFIILTGAL